MLPHIFHFDIFFIFLREWKSAISRLLLNCFHIIQNSKQAPPTVVQTSFEYCFYSNRLIWGGALLCGGNNSTTSSFFVFRWLSIFWITNGCAWDTSLCLSLRGSMRYANQLSCRFFDTRYNLPPPHCSQVFISIPKTRLTVKKRPKTAH